MSNLILPPLKCVCGSAGLGACSSWCDLVTGQHTQDAYNFNFGAVVVAKSPVVEVSFDELTHYIIGRHKDYSGNCRNLHEPSGIYCCGNDLHPLNDMIMLCEYHGSLVRKLNLLKLSQLEYISNHSSIIQNIKANMLNAAESKKCKELYHNIRLTAMTISDEKFIKCHRELFLCGGKL